LQQGIYQGIEIFYPYDVTPSAQADYRQGLVELLLEKPEVVLHLPFGKANDLCDPSLRDEVIVRLKEAIHFGETLQAKKFTLHLGYTHANRSDELKGLVPVLQSLCDETPHIIMIENMPRETEIGVAPDEIYSLIKEAGRPNLKFILDTGHAHLSSYSFKDYFDGCGALLMHMHWSDNRGQHDEHKPIGTGTIDFHNVLNHTARYQELYCLEIIYQTVDDLVEYAKTFNALVQAHDSLLKKD
jgi:sugar phosphate isomerase/epimerase